MTIYGQRSNDCNVDLNPVGKNCLDEIEYPISEIVIEGLNFHVYGNFLSESDANSEWISVVKIPAHFMWPLFVCRCLSDPGHLSPNLSFGISQGYVYFSQWLSRYHYKMKDVS